MLSIAVLDDYQDVALTIADWSQLGNRAQLTRFTDHVGDSDALVGRLAPFDIVVAMEAAAA